MENKKFSELNIGDKIWLCDVDCQMGRPESVSSINLTFSVINKITKNGQSLDIVTNSAEFEIPDGSVSAINNIEGQPWRFSGFVLATSKKLLTETLANALNMYERGCTSFINQLSPFRDKIKEYKNNLKSQI